MEYENLLLAKEGGVSTVTINRPKTLNALNIATILELHACFEDIASDEDVHAVILTGAGEKSFVAGADISEIAELNGLTGKEFARRGNALYSFIEAMHVPVIAAINGFALGGGCELAMACHLRIASEKAKFGQPEINLGIIPGYGGTQRLPRLIGRGRALDLLLTGRMISAQDALDFGLVNSISKPESLLEDANSLAADLATKAPVATQAILEAVQIGLQIGQDHGLKIEEDQFALCCGTADKNEGTRAFLEKRKAEFTGQ